MLVSEPCAIHRFGAVQEFSVFAASSARLAAAIGHGSATLLEFRTVSNLWIAQGLDTNVVWAPPAICTRSRSRSRSRTQSVREHPAPAAAPGREFQRGKAWRGTGRPVQLAVAVLDGTASTVGPAGARGLLRRARPLSRGPRAALRASLRALQRDEHRPAERRVRRARTRAVRARGRRLSARGFAPASQARAARRSS